MNSLESLKAYKALAPEQKRQVHNWSGYMAIDDVIGSPTDEEYLAIFSAAFDGWAKDECPAALSTYTSVLSEAYSRGNDA